MMEIRTIIFTVHMIVWLTLLALQPSFGQDDPPWFIENPSYTIEYAAENRKYTGVPSLAVSSNGRIWATWFAGITPGEDRNSYVVLATSGDQGETWEEVLVADPDGPGPDRVFNPEIWMDPNGKLWFFWVQTRENYELWALTTDQPDEANPIWSEPRRITDGNMMCKPTVLSTGEWILPVSHPRIKDGARVVVSSDQGQSWNIRGAVHVPEEVWHWDEHMVVERGDGSLWMLVRTTYGIGESTSHDRGVTWSPLTPSNIENPTARFFIRRLNSGNILLVKNGPINIRTGRTHMMAYISEDEGHTWSGGLLLDGRLGVSYPDGQQVEDGTIYIIYDFDRKGVQQILMTSFREDDIVSCYDKMLEVKERRCLVSKGGLNAYLGAIIWPDMPFILEGWKGDTIPLFSPLRNSYSVTLPYGTARVPVLSAIPLNLRTSIHTIRATSLTGSWDERTTTFQVRAEDDTTYIEYRVTFNLEKPVELVQPYQFKGHPFISEMITSFASWLCLLEISHAGNVPLDLSQYMFVRSTTLDPVKAITNAIPSLPSDANFQNRYVSYIPGYRYSDDTTAWKDNPGRLYPDPQIDPVILPGNVFVMASVSIGRFVQVDMRPELAARINKRWDSYEESHIDELGVNVRMTPAGVKRNAEAVFIYKILNDSIFEGTKEVGDPADFSLVDAFGDEEADGVWKIAGKEIVTWTPARLRRKPHIFEGTTKLEDTGTAAEDSEWIVEVSPEDIASNDEFFTYVGSHDMNPLTLHLSTITSRTCLVSDGYAGLQSVEGDFTGTTLEQFYNQISKADPRQELIMKSGANGAEKGPEDEVSGNDTLLVLSADGYNTTLYLLIDQPLDSDAVLVGREGSGYVIEIEGRNGKITGMEFGATLREVLNNVIKPVHATLNVIDSLDNLVPIQKRTTFSEYVGGRWLYNYTYVDTRVGDAFFLEVVAQDGTMITYSLKPDVHADDAFVISSVYRIDQDNLIISGIPHGTSVCLFFTNISVVQGASAGITDKSGLCRNNGVMLYDDRLVVTSGNQTKTVTYYLDFLNELDPDRPDEDDPPVWTEPIKPAAGETHVYPNPVSDMLFVRDVPEGTILYLTDMMGRIILVKTLRELETGISLSGNPAGVYLLWFLEGNRLIECVNIIKCETR
jgi:hypothetical protein